MLNARRATWAALTGMALDALAVRPGEGRRTLVLFAHLFLASSVFVMGRTVRDTLFLSRYGIDALPWMFIAYGAASAVTVVLYTNYAERLPRHRLIAGWCALGVVTYLATYTLVRLEVGVVYPIFYVWSEVFANLMISQFWTLANDLYDPRAAKRLFGTIGSARVLGVIAVGLGSGAIVERIGTDQLLFVLCALCGGVAALALHARHFPRAVSSATRRRPRKAKGREPLVRDAYVISLALMLLCAFAALTIGDYQFKAVARATYREDDLARFFSYFYAVTGILSFVFQVVATPRLLARFGVSTGLGVMPVVFGGASALSILWPSLPVVTVMKFADNGLQYTIHDTTMQALYVPFSGTLRTRARAFLDGMVKPFSYGLGGAMLLFVAPLGAAKLGAVSTILVAGWFATIPWVRRHYMAKLAGTLRVLGVSAFEHEPVRDVSQQILLMSALSADDPRVVLAAIDEISSRSKENLTPRLLELAAHHDSDVRVGALRRLIGFRNRVGPHAIERIEAALHDVVPEVRAAAAEAYAAIRGDESCEGLVPLLGDAEPQVRTAVLCAMLHYAGFEGAMTGGAHLSELLASSAKADRRAAADALGSIGPTATRRLLPLLSDPDPGVRRSAVLAAERIADRRLLPAVLDNLAYPPCQHAAASALSAFGPAAIAPLAARLCDPNEPRPIRLLIPRILRRIGTVEGYRALWRALDDPDGHVRLRVLSALSRVREEQGLPFEPEAACKHLLERELRGSVALAWGYELAEPQVGTELLGDAISTSVQRGARRVLRILELASSPAPIRLLRDSIFDPSRRANALEVLDSAIAPGLRSFVMPFFDDLPMAAKARLYGVVAWASPEELIARRMRSANPHTALVAFDAASVHRLLFAAEQARSVGKDADPIVREGALLLLVATDREAAIVRAQELASDANRTLSRIAQRVLFELSLGPPPEVAVYTTVEKLLMLRATPMFEKIPGEELSPLARVAEVLEFQSGEEIFEVGDPGDALYVIAKGKVAIRQGEQTLAMLGRGETLGEMSVLDAEPRSATAIALEPSELLVIGSEELYEVMREHVEIAEGIIRVLSKRLRAANRSFEVRE